LEFALRFSGGIVKGERSELLTHIATTEKAIYRAWDEKLTAFLELEGLIPSRSFSF
jgi:hypothetical protein